MLATPKRRRTVIVWAAVLFVSAPVVASWVIIEEYNRGAFPPEADSISIPIFGFVILTVMTAPLSWGLVWFCTRHYPGSLPLTSWNNLYPVWSIAWTLPAIAGALAFAVAGVLMLAEYHFPVAVHALADAWMILVLRSCVVRQSTMQAEHQAM